MSALYRRFAVLVAFIFIMAALTAILIQETRPAHSANLVPLAHTPLAHAPFIEGTFSHGQKMNVIFP